MLQVSAADVGLSEQKQRSLLCLLLRRIVGRFLHIGDDLRPRQFSTLSLFTNIYGRKIDFVTEKSKNLQIVYKFRQKTPSEMFFNDFRYMLPKPYWLKNMKQLYAEI